MAPEQELKHIVRISNTDMDGNKEVFIALKKIKGLEPLTSEQMFYIIMIDDQTLRGIAGSIGVEAGFWPALFCAGGGPALGAGGTGQAGRAPGGGGAGGSAEDGPGAAAGARGPLAALAGPLTP